MPGVKDSRSLSPKLSSSGRSWPSATATSGLVYNLHMHIHSVRAELRTFLLKAPFVISKRTAVDAQNVFVTVESSGGDGLTVTGHGACAPVAYVTGETVDSVLSALADAAEQLTGVSVDDHLRLLEQVQDTLPAAHSARAGLEMALYDLWAKHRGISLWRHFGAALTAVHTDLTIPISSPATAAAVAVKARAAGFRALKIKVGACEGVDADLHRIAAIVEATPDVRLRIDANQAFTPEGAVAFAHRLLSVHSAVDLIEQPVDKADIDGLKFVKEALTVPVYADEAVCTPEDAAKMLKMDAVDGINIKLMKSGITGALRIIDLCRAAGKGLMIGCMLETGLGIAAAAQIAAGTGAFNYIDLDSHTLLVPVPEVAGGFVAEGDRLDVAYAGDAYGWGVMVADHPHHS